MGKLSLELAQSLVDDPPSEPLAISAVHLAEPGSQPTKTASSLGVR